MDAAGEALTRIPPHDTQAEHACLSCMLSDAEALGVSCEALVEDDFYDSVSKELYAALKDLYVKNVPVDIITLSDRLKEKGVFEQTGGADFLSRLVGLFFSSANIKQYIKIVKDKAVFRRLAAAGRQIADLGYAANDDVSNVLDICEQSVFNIIKNRHTSDFHHIRDVMLSVVDEMEHMRPSEKSVSGVPSGFLDIDLKTAGFKPSNLVLIAARPSMGKTSLMLNIAEHAALRKNVTTAVFSLEMSKEENVNRLLCSCAKVDSQKLRLGEAGPADLLKIFKASTLLGSAPIYIDDTSGITPAELRAKCRKLKLEKNLGLIIIDYLQLMNGNGRFDSRQQEISEISRGLKALAREMEAPVIVGSQLSRACEMRANHRPMLSDLRESGAIEQDADIVAFIYRESYYDETAENPNQTELILAKQRNGPTGTVGLVWRPAYTRFENEAKY